jgi:hypothetical protein
VTERLTVSLTTDRRRFTKQLGEPVATDGAVFLSNMLATARNQ